MNRDYSIKWAMEGDSMVIVQPEYDCPVHGTITSVVTFNIVADGNVRHFCMECCFDKLVEIGVSEAKEKKA